MRAEVPDYERIQDEVAAATDGVAARAVLELGVGTGETSRQVLDRHPGGRLIGIDESGGRFVLADVVVPTAAAYAVTPLDAGFDLPDSVPEQLQWLAEAGFRAEETWTKRDMAVLCADLSPDAYA
jgi:hypothetical protein